MQRHQVKPGPSYHQPTGCEYVFADDLAAGAAGVRGNSVGTSA